jgi:superfamily I DNA/RNA helicase
MWQSVGVLYRVEELADREDGRKPQKYHPYYSVIPLLDIFAEILRVGPKSKKVAHAHATTIQQLGSEFNILHHLQPQAIDEAGIPLLGEAVRRMRNKQIEVLPGYDGEYGQVKIFSAQEREQIIGQQPLFSIPTPAKSSEKTEKKKTQPTEKKSPSKNPSLVLDPEESDGAVESGNNLDRLNKEQRRAVQHPVGPLLIVAGPGTGKTLTLTHRIAYLIRHQGVSFQNILAVTFTNKAAEEMHLRLQRILDDASQIPLVTTFHALCFKILNDLDPRKKESIIDEDGRKYLIAETLRFLKQKGTPISLKPREILDRIIAAKQRILGPDEIAKRETDEAEGDQFAEIYRTYQQLLAIQSLNDYEDLIFKVVRLLETNLDICERYRNIFQHLFVDEYQDLNQGQYQIIRALAPSQHLTHDICVIGDPDQSIYGFRGSDFKYFKQFVKDYPRSEAGTILDASYQVIKTQHPQPSGVRTYSQIDGVKTISIIELNNERAEAETIARIIEKQVGGTGFHSIDTGTIDDANLSSARSYSDFAVLYRINDQHRVIADVFEKSGIPCQIASRENSLNQQGLPEIISFLKVVSGCAGYGDHEKVLRFSNPAIGKKTLSEFKLWCYQKQFSLADGLRQAKRFPIPRLKPSTQQMLNDISDHLQDAQTKVTGMTVAQKLLYLTRHSNWIAFYQDNVASKEALDNLVAFSKRFGSNTTDFFTHVALHTDTDAYVSRAEKVSLMTLHAAKGLEFPVVFISGCEQDYIPLQRSADDVTDIQEERRLFYVAMTRAMERLYLTGASKRRIYGSNPAACRPSWPISKPASKKLKAPRRKRQINNNSPYSKGFKFFRLIDNCLSIDGHTV